MQSAPVRITKLLLESEHRLLLQLWPMFVLVVSTINTCEQATPYFVTCFHNIACMHSRSHYDITLNATTLRPNLHQGWNCFQGFPRNQIIHIIQCVYV